MADQPSTTGFLCHICIWRERAESHELMDIEALMRHGMRFHYLVREQFDEYLRAAYQAVRAPSPSPGAFILPVREVQHNPVADGMSVEVMEAGTWLDDGEVRELPIKAESLEEMSPQLDSFSYLVPPSFGLTNFERCVALNDLQELCSGPPIKFSNSFKYSEQGDADRSSTFNDPKSRPWNPLFLSGNHHDPDLDGYLFGGAIANPLALSNYRLGLNHHHSELLHNAIVLAQFDSEIARSHLFTTQLEEYEERRYLGLPEAFGVKLPGWDKEDERDWLQLWPEKVAPVEEMLGGSVKGVEIDDIILMGGGEFGEGGEAGDFMDLLDFEGGTC